MKDGNLSLVLQRCLLNGSKSDWEVFISLAQPVIAAGVLRSLTRMYVFRRELADDLIQDTFLRICADNFRILRNFRATDSNALCVYLKTIASSIVVDYLRSGKARKSVALDEIAGCSATDTATHQQLERRMLLEQVEKCLGHVEERSHRVFWLYHRQGLKPKEIAALPGIGMGTSGVETAVYRLTGQVRECLREAGWLEPVTFREGGRT